MITLLGLLAIPLIIGLVAYLKGHGQLTLKELAVQEGALILIIAGFYGLTVKITHCAATRDKEIWSGFIAQKRHGTQGCCHSYQCNCVQVCSGTGQNQTCTDVCSTCYEHGYDLYWDAITTNGETAFEDACNPPGTSTPARWEGIRQGETTAIEHTFTNYIKAAPQAVIRSRGQAAKFGALIPPYPRVYDLYRARRFMFVGLAENPPEAGRLNDRLDQINAELGRRKQVNLIVLVVAARDRKGYMQGLTEVWLGGKKNDLVLVIGAPDYPKIGWVEVMTWSQSKEVRERLGQKVAYLDVFQGPKVLKILAEVTETGFVRRPMKDFEYLLKLVDPPWWSLLIVFLLGLGLSIGLTAYFLRNDSFSSYRRY